MPCWSDIRNGMEINADLKLCIMRSPGSYIPNGWRHVPSLAPSWDLFKWYRRHQFDRKGWWSEYKQRFYAEMELTEIRPEDLKLGAKSSPAQALILVKNFILER